MVNKKLIGSAFWVLVVLAFLGMPVFTYTIVDAAPQWRGEAIVQVHFANWALICLMVASIFTFVAFKSFLKDYAGYAGANTTINAIICCLSLAVLTDVTYLSHQLTKQLTIVVDAGTSVSAIAFGVSLLFLGRFVSRCENSLFEYRRMLSINYFGQAACSFIGGIPATLLFGIISNIVLAMIFHKAIEESDEEAAGGSTGNEWKVMSKGQKLGPLSKQELLSWALDGRLKAVDLVWRVGMPGWLPAGDVPELASVRSSMAAPKVAMGDDPMMRALLPVGRSGWAIAAGYLGLVSLLIVPAPFALFCGLMAVRDIRKNPKKRGMGRAIFGLVLGVLGTALIVFLFLRKLK